MHVCWLPVMQCIASVVQAHVTNMAASNCGANGHVCLQKERLKRPGHCPDSLWQLIEACWQQQPEARPSFQTMLRTLKQLEAEMQQQQQQQHEADMQGMSQYQHSAGAGAAAPEVAGAAIRLHQQQ
jgi:hypothetical protein